MSRFDAFPRFRADARGNFAINFALIAPLLIGGVGFGLDQWVFLSEKARLDSAADVAAVTAAKAAVDYMHANPSDPNVTQDAIAAAQTAGAGAFSVNAGPSARDLQGTPIINVTYANSVFTASATYSAQVKTAFGPLVGINTLSTTHTATATNNASKYMDLILVIDNSESMGIGTDETNQRAMYAVTNCTVGCHLPNWDTLTQLRNAGITNTTRIDVVRTSIANQLQTLHDTTYTGQIRVSVYTFSGTLQQLVAPTTDLLAAKATVLGTSSAPGLDVTAAQTVVNTGGGDGGTFTTYALEQLPGQLSRPGDGSSPTSRSGSIIIFSDGVQDDQNFWWKPYWNFSSAIWGGNPAPNYILSTQPQSYWYDGFLEPFDPSVCDPLKSLGFTIYSLDFEYLITDYTVQTDNTGDRYTVLKNMKPTIQQNMAACATNASDAAVASTVPEFQTAMNGLISKATSTLRLTQ